MGLNDNPNIPEMIVFCLLGIACISFREKIFYMLIPFITLFMLFSMKKAGRFNKKKILVCLCIILYALGAKYLDAGYYCGEYSDLLDVNLLRSQMQDYTGFPAWDASFEETGINENEYELMQSGLYGLCDNLNAETLTKINERARSEFSSRNIRKILADMKNMTFAALGKFPTYIYVLLAILFAYSIMLALKSHKIINWFMLICIIGGWGIEWLYLAYSGRMPYRAIYPLMVTLLVSLFIYDIAMTPTSRDCRDSLIAMIIVCVFSLFGSIFHRMEFVDYDELVGLEEYMISNEDISYLHFRDSSWDKVVLFNPPRYNYTKALGWVTETPDWKEFVKGEYDDFWDAIAKRNDLVWILEDGDDWYMDLIKEQLANRGYDVRFSYEKVGIYGIDYRVCNIDMVNE